MNVLVTGAAGFVGNYLVKELLKKKVSVRALVRKNSNIKDMTNNGVELVYGNITDRDSLQGITENVDVVYHLAAMGHVSAASEEAYRKSYEVNVTGTQNLIEECLKAEVKRFIHFSSTAAMGLIKQPTIDESAECQPSTPYQRSKYESEQCVNAYFRDKDLPSLILRPCMIYGVGGRGEFLKWCRLIKKGFFPKVGMGENLTPFVHVKDVVQAAVLAADNGQEGETYLVASEQSYSLTLIRNLVAKHLDVKKPYVYVPKWAALAGTYALENAAKWLKFTPVVTSKNIRSISTDRVFSIEKAENQLGYHSLMDLETGIKETVHWYRDQGYL
jgi:nucleoside-diphosphate-sugar epimerase